MLHHHPVVAFYIHQTEGPANGNGKGVMTCHLQT